MHFQEVVIPTRLLNLSPIFTAVYSHLKNQAKTSSFTKDYWEKYRWKTQLHQGTGDNQQELFFLLLRDLLSIQGNRTISKSSLLNSMANTGSSIMQLLW